MKKSATIKKKRIRRAPWGRPRLHDIAPTPILVRLTESYLQVVDQFATIMRESRPATIRRMIAIASRKMDEALRKRQ